MVRRRNDFLVAFLALCMACQMSLLGSLWALRFGLTAAIVALGLFSISHWRATQATLLLLSFYVFILIWFGVYLLLGRNIDFQVTRYYLIYPLYFIFILGFFSFDFYQNIFLKTFYLASLGISIVASLTWLFWFFSILPDFTTVVTEITGANFGYSHYNFRGLLAVYLFAVFLLAKIVVNVERNSLKKIDLFSLGLSFVLVFFSGRRALIVGLCLFVCLAAIRFFRLRFNLSVGATLILGVPFLLLGLGFLIENIYFSELDLSVRGEQFYKLLLSFPQNGFWGLGPGGAIELSYRNTVGYEFWVLYQLACFGVPLSIILAIIYFHTIQKLYSLTKGSLHRDKYIPMLHVFLAALIAGSSNPYLGNFHSMWPIFIPFFLAGSSMRMANHNEF